MRKEKDLEVGRGADRIQFFAEGIDRGQRERFRDKERRAKCSSTQSLLLTGREKSVFVRKY